MRNLSKNHDEHDESETFPCLRGLSICVCWPNMILDHHKKNTCQTNLKISVTHGLQKNTIGGLGMIGLGMSSSVKGQCFLNQAFRDKTTYINTARIYP